MNGRYAVTILRRAQKALAAVPSPEFARLRDALRDLADEPRLPDRSEKPVSSERFFGIEPRSPSPWGEGSGVRGRIDTPISLAVSRAFSGRT